eukprot:scaffold1638_cov258-Pinguiococcus_pyrenoidosus.AAC.35
MGQKEGGGRPTKLEARQLDTKAPGRENQSIFASPSVRDLSQCREVPSAALSAATTVVTKHESRKSTRLGIKSHQKYADKTRLRPPLLLELVEFDLAVSIRVAVADDGVCVFHADVLAHDRQHVLQRLSSDEARAACIKEVERPSQQLDRRRLDVAEALDDEADELVERQGVALRDVAVLHHPCDLLVRHVLPQHLKGSLQLLHADLAVVIAVDSAEDLSVHLCDICVDALRCPNVFWVGRQLRRQPPYVGSRSR